MGANAEPTGPLGGPQLNPSPASLAPQHAVAASTAAAAAPRPRARRPVDARGAGHARRRIGQDQKMLMLMCLLRNRKTVFSCCVGFFVGYAADAVVVRYAKIAMTLPDKTVRDVALRCRWMAEKASDSSTKGPSHLVSRPNAPPSPYSLPVLPMDDDDVSYKTIGGSTGQLLEHNAQVQENIPLLCQTRDNILAVLKEICDVPEIMKQMPPLPVKLNEDLANSMLPRPPHT
ncbi:hypothetical protein GUJ93_ZPchr0005g14779 [Zizania palustris]|uniref:Uncharacterized protein n=1 Tax=Zizania palustris TaxID=103762 RepID=A0A8J5T6H4_ZIZPA|nr:hypothetical protein GUJ93_ZPchr0005g14779 [Zizania palustris]